MAFIDSGYELFTFTSSYYDTQSIDKFGVVLFNGKETISSTFEFDILLISDDTPILIDEVLKNKACFTIKGEERLNVYHGIISKFQQLHEFNGYIFYQVKFVPSMWILNLTFHNQVFIDKSLTQMIQGILSDCNISSTYYGTTLADLNKEKYLSDENPYVCQYGETHFNFLSRWLEKNGIFYFFEQDKNNEKISFLNEKSDLKFLVKHDIDYSPTSGLDPGTEFIHSFNLCQTRMPQRLQLNDYNYNTPNANLTNSVVMDSEGKGDVYYFGDHYNDSDSGGILATIFQEEFLCRQKEFNGESNVTSLRTGYKFALKKHYSDDFNKDYLVTEIIHKGNQTRYVTGDVGRDPIVEEDKYFYKNQFKAIRADVQFRPQRKATWPRIYGNISAKIDATEDSGNYAYLDEQGRYKVILPFDLSPREAGKASAWIRMAQPHAGGNEVIENTNKTGVHFPLRKGTEVLLSFIDGDPDRPVITGAVPNPVTESVITKKNHTKAVISTEGDNRMIFDDKAGTITFKSGDGSIYLVGGEKSDTTKIEKKHKFDITKGLQIGMTGLMKGTMSMFMRTNITGWKKAQIMALAAESVIEAGLEIAAEKIGETKDVEEGGFKWNWGESMVVPVVMLFINSVIHKILHNYIEKKLEGKLAGDIPEHLCYAVINKDGHTIQTQNSRIYGFKRKNMLFAARDGNLAMYAGQNMPILVGSDFQLTIHGINYQLSEFQVSFSEKGMLILNSSTPHDYNYLRTAVNVRKGIVIENESNNEAIRILNSGANGEIDLEAKIKIETKTSDNACKITLETVTPAVPANQKIDIESPNIKLTGTNNVKLEGAGGGSIELKAGLIEIKHGTKINIDQIKIHNNVLTFAAGGTGKINGGVIAVRGTEIKIG